MDKLNLEMGQIYRNRRGESALITGVVTPDSRWDYECGMRFRDDIGRTYRPDGTYNNIPSYNHLDLVEQITDPSELIKLYTDRMRDIYDADRDYDICFADLDQESQDRYNALKEKRDTFLK